MKRQGCEIDAGIAHRELQKIAAVAHHDHHGACNDDTNHRTDRAADKGDNRGRMYCHVGALMLPCPDVARDHNSRTDRQTDKEIEQQANEGTRSTDGTHGIRLAGMTDHDHICGIVECLQQIGDHQWEYKDQDLAKKRAVCHINFLFRFYHDFLSGTWPSKQNTPSTTIGGYCPL